VTAEDLRKWKRSCSESVNKAEGSGSQRRAATERPQGPALIMSIS